MQHTAYAQYIAVRHSYASANIPTGSEHGSGGYASEQKVG